MAGTPTPTQLLPIVGWAPDWPGAEALGLVSSVPSVLRILIVDWDIHHGQGIQYTFEDDPR